MPGLVTEDVRLIVAPTATRSAAVLTNAVLVALAAVLAGAAVDAATDARLDFVDLITVAPGTAERRTRGHSGKTAFANDGGDNSPQENADERRCDKQDDEP